MHEQLLRPQFTQNIYEQYVLAGKSVNIFGEKGSGKSRFIEDLEKLIDKDTKFISF